MKYCFFFILWFLLSECSGQSAGAGTSYENVSLGRALAHNDRIGINIGGKNYQIEQEFKNRGVMISGVNHDLGMSAVLAIDGEDIRAVIVANSDQDSLLEFGGKGMVAQLPPSGSARYLGEYRLVSAFNPNLNNQTQDVFVDVDFEAGTLFGRSMDDAPGVRQSQFRGIYDGKEIEMVFYDDTGIHHGGGNFYGDDGGELMGFYLADIHGGMLYAKKD